MFIKDPYSLLAEAAENDLSVNTSMALTESQVNSIIESFDEVSEDVVYTAEMVSVIKVGDDYLTEMNALYPYMKSNGITSVAEALNNVAAVNGLQEKAVGLLIESDERTSEMLAEACKKGSKAKEKALDKIKKATKIPAKLKKEGFPVKKKKADKNKSKSAKDEGCTKEGCKTAVDEAEDPDMQHNRMMKKMEIEKKNGEGVDSDGYNARVSVTKHNKYAEKRSNDKYKNNHQSNGFDSNSDAVERHNRRHPEDKIVKGNRVKNESATDAGGIFDFDLM